MYNHSVLFFWLLLLIKIDHPTSEGILYKDEIVKEYENKPNGHIRVKDNMGRIWFVPKNILKEYRI